MWGPADSSLLTIELGNQRYILKVKVRSKVYTIYRLYIQNKVLKEKERTII